MRPNCPGQKGKVNKQTSRCSPRGRGHCAVLSGTGWGRRYGHRLGARLRAKCVVRSHRRDFGRKLLQRVAEARRRGRACPSHTARPGHTGSSVASPGPRLLGLHSEGSRTLGQALATRAKLYAASRASTPQDTQAGPGGRTKVPRPVVAKQWCFYQEDDLLEAAVAVALGTGQLLLLEL